MMNNNAGGDEDERERDSIAGEEESVHSSVNKSIRKYQVNGPPAANHKNSIHGSQKSGSKRGSKVGMSKKEEHSAAPVPTKIDIP